MCIHSLLSYLFWEYNILSNSHERHISPITGLMHN
uniref:Uncharacterized protein n=1 Tax=Siphoviridae sp. ctwHj1 TaxID=2825727 RepID=A0A8S5U654_9CAUD|nr:MAG TPA: hypothetical protein [Siphoviridae sp. ctwHj1]